MYPLPRCEPLQGASRAWACRYLRIFPVHSGRMPMSMMLGQAASSTLRRQRSLALAALRRCKRWWPELVYGNRGWHFSHGGVARQNYNGQIDPKTSLVVVSCSA